MDNYIKVSDGEEPFYFTVEDNNTVILETVQSAFPRCCGLCFYVKNKCFVVTLQRGIFHLPKEYWKFIFEPIFDDDYDDEDDDEDEYSDDGYEYDDDGHDKTNVSAKPPQEDINELYYHMLNDDHDKTNVGAKPPEKEDINVLYYDMLNDKNYENDYDSYDDDS